MTKHKIRQWIAASLMALTITSSGAGTSKTLSMSQVTDTTTRSHTVYVCTGEHSKRYHQYENCAGLNACKARIIEVSLSKAKKMKRTPCQRCHP